MEQLDFSHTMLRMWSNSLQKCKLVNIFVYIFLTGQMLTEFEAARVIFSSLPGRNGSSVQL